MNEFGGGKVILNQNIHDQDKQTRSYYSLAVLQQIRQLR